ncbi:general stress protein [Paenibacillus macerans]|uniref:General stress protein n=1 Tax=Paenibacillus macerans TaxID=44252 RepID=A0A090YR03_PAEMA|nr:pyridoxamine 5'-phosphate oxidase family protein [Paenibacillus macerans]KFM94530.1 pyridoxamine 5'-phosphate oxidase family protein [Paenibacillus macerans]MBS5909564.1 pyridoxamine 5'-phosphate oxidase family protein [Paenibacillus macerans]MCY7557231.1 pyridoxamine 5'-phosphate oxidase family protein [Paenibacillus macerans]MDU5947399.1 pyridoxamine 5'-phosphate oxidase family protein [Paenibacillus macerans]MDU7471847.1 pyridoxamine 5'-phosphate oxidase family protein [Paenibacillus mac
MTNDQAAHQAAVETVRELIKGIEIAMLTTVTKEGLVSRPMKTQEVEFDGDLWFLTKEDTDKYRQLRDNPNVNVAYAGKSYVSIRGKGELVEDRAKIKELWNPAYAKLLNTTSDDPQLALIKVRAEAAEYWETGNWTKMMKRMFSQFTGAASEAEVNKTVTLV